MFVTVRPEAERLSGQRVQCRETRSAPRKFLPCDCRTSTAPYRYLRTAVAIADDDGGFIERRCVERRRSMSEMMVDSLDVQTVRWLDCALCEGVPPDVILLPMSDGQHGVECLG